MAKYTGMYTNPLFYDANGHGIPTYTIFDSYCTCPRPTLSGWSHSTFWRNGHLRHERLKLLDKKEKFNSLTIYTFRDLSFSLHLFHLDLSTSHAVLSSHIVKSSPCPLPALFDAPWLADHTALILIRQHPKCLRWLDIRLHHGMDLAAHPKKADLTHALQCQIDQSWSLWITLRYRNLHIKAYRNEHFSRPCTPTTFEIRLPPNMRRCLHTHVFWNPMKSQQYRSNIFALLWWSAYVLNGALTFWLRIWSFAMLILPGMSSKSPTLRLYLSFWMNTAQTGAFVSTTTFIRPPWFLVPQLHSSFDYNATKSAKGSFSPEHSMHLQNKKRASLALGLSTVILKAPCWPLCICSWGLIISQHPSVHLLPFVFQFLPAVMSTMPRYMLRHRSFCIAAAICFAHIYSWYHITDHGEQTWCLHGGSALASFYYKGCTFAWRNLFGSNLFGTAHYDGTISQSNDLDPYYADTIFESNDLDPFDIRYIALHSSYFTEHHFYVTYSIYDPINACTAFPTHGAPPLWLLYSSSPFWTYCPSDPVQDLHAGQQRPQPIYWRDSSLRYS